MEAAYGLAITLCMIMTTILLGYYMYLKRVHIIIIAIVEIAYLSLEVSFFIANVQKFTHGGYVTVFIASLLAGTMVINYLAKKIRKNYTEFVNIEQYKDVLQDISTDTSIPKFASNLIYLTNSNTCSKIEYKILYSITQRIDLLFKKLIIKWLSYSKSSLMQLALKKKKKILNSFLFPQYICSISE